MKDLLKNCSIFAVACLLGYSLTNLLSPKQDAAIALNVDREIAGRNVKTENDLKLDAVVFRIPDSLENKEYQEPLENFIVLDESNVFRKSEVIAKDGENWLLLAKKGNKFSLISAKATVKQLKTGSWPGDETDAKLSFPNAKGYETLFAFKDITPLKPGEIKTVYEYRPIDSPYPSTDNITSIDFYLEGATSRLKTANGINNKGQLAAVLMLEQNGRQQMLRRRYNPDSPEQLLNSNHLIEFGNVLWAGDLDNDGKLDLMIDKANEIGATSVDLYLSSKAVGDELVGFAANFLTQGC